MTLSFRTDRSGQTVQTQIRLLLEEQEHLGFGLFFLILGRLQQRFLASENLGTLLHIV